jgi:hypothetical protein
MIQLNLLTAQPVVVTQAPAPMRPRLSRQCHAILERLQAGPATNRELAMIALKYTGRISELKQAGYRVECFEHKHATGLTRYRLV